MLGDEGLSQSLGTRTDRSRYLVCDLRGAGSPEGEIRALLCNPLRINQRLVKANHKRLLISSASDKGDSYGSGLPVRLWRKEGERRRPFNVAVAAVANKLARTIWAVLARPEKYRALPPATA